MRFIAEKPNSQRIMVYEEETDGQTGDLHATIQICKQPSGYESRFYINMDLGMNRPSVISTDDLKPKRGKKTTQNFLINMYNENLGNFLFKTIMKELGKTEREQVTFT